MLTNARNQRHENQQECCYLSANLKEPPNKEKCYLWLIQLTLAKRKFWPRTAQITKNNNDDDNYGT